MCNSPKKDAKKVLEKNFFAAHLSTTPHFCYSLWVPEHEKNGEHYPFLPTKSISNFDMIFSLHFKPLSFSPGTSDIISPKIFWKIM